MKHTIRCIGLSIIVAGTMATFTGCAGDRYNQSTGQHMDDKATSMRVRSALRDDAEYKYPMVEVKTFKGTAQLSGFVNNRDQKSRAGDIAKRIEGVQRIENNITVKD